MATPPTPLTPAVHRLYARLGHFQCACPSCGRLMTSYEDQGRLARHLHAGRQHKPKPGRSIGTSQKLTWNPVTQRLSCPWCGAGFYAGLVLYRVRTGVGRAIDPPPDIQPTRAERLQARSLAASWYVDHPSYKNHAPVNLVVEGREEGDPILPALGANGEISPGKEQTDKVLEKVQRR